MGKVRTLVSLTKLSVKTLRDYLNKILLFIPKLFLMITSVSSKMNQSLEICCRYRVQLRILLPPYDLPKICTPPPIVPVSNLTNQWTTKATFTETVRKPNTLKHQTQNLGSVRTSRQEFLAHTNNVRMSKYPKGELFPGFLLIISKTSIRK